MKEDKWIHDIQAGELINLKDCKSVWIYKDRDEYDDYPAEYTLYFAYYRDKSDTYLHYDSSELLHNAFEHYKNILQCKDLDVTQKPVTL